MAKASEEPKTDMIQDALHAITSVTRPGSTTEPMPVLTDNITKAKIVEIDPDFRTKKKLNGARIQLRGYLHNSWDVTVERGVQLCDVLDTDFWTHVAYQFKPHDNVQVISEDGTWYARLLVINADRLWAKMYKLEYHDLTASYLGMPKTQEEEYEVTWNSIGKYGLVKKSMHGQPPLKDGFQTKLEAYQWLDGHLRTLNR